jgi:hypothetical protein
MNRRGTSGHPGWREYRRRDVVASNESNYCKGVRRPHLWTPPRVLGFAGLMPFIALAAMIRLGPGTWYVYWMTALSYYGAVILTIVGALQWAYALKRSARGGSAWLQYGFSVAPALIAWLSLLLPVWSALQLQAGGLLVCYAFDRNMACFDPVPAWFLRMRAVLTLVGAASLTFASWA